MNGGGAHSADGRRAFSLIVGSIPSRRFWQFLVIYPQGAMMAKVTVGDILDRMEGIDRDCEVRVLRSAWRSSPEYLKQDQDIVFLDDLYLSLIHI